MAVRRILIVRHGESAWNAQGRWQGRADPPLSDLGARQAVVASKRLALDPPDAVWTSPLARAAGTAALIAAELGVGPVRSDPDLVERDVGEWSGLTRDDIDERYPGWLDLSDQQSAFAPSERHAPRRPPGWEHDDAVLARALAALGRIVAASGDDDRVLVVAHGGLIYTVEAHLGERAGRLPNLGGRWILADGDGALALGDRVVLLDPDDVPVTVPGQL